MIIDVYSVRDNALGAFLPPFFARARGEALRSFSSAVNEEGHQFRKHASDYTLFFLGTFDDSSGLLATVEPLRCVSALEVIVSEEAAFLPPTRSNGAIGNDEVMRRRS